MPADDNSPVGGSVQCQARSGAGAPVSEPQSIRNRSKESEEGGATQTEKGGREFSKSVVDRTYAKRIVLAAFEVNREQTCETDADATFVRSSRESNLARGARRSPSVTSISGNRASDRPDKLGRGYPDFTRRSRL